MERISFNFESGIRVLPETVTYVSVTRQRDAYIYIYTYLADIGGGKLKPGRGGGWII